MTSSIITATVYTLKLLVMMALVGVFLMQFVADRMSTNDVLAHGFTAVVLMLIAIFLRISVYLDNKKRGSEKRQIGTMGIVSIGPVFGLVLSWEKANYSHR